MLTNRARHADDTYRGASAYYLKMLKNLTEGKLQSNCIIIEDHDVAWGQDLLCSFLKSCVYDDSIKKINLICFENPPAFYLRSAVFSQEKITCYDYFTDPCGWNNQSSSKPNLTQFTSDINSIQQTAFCIDSLSLLTNYCGFFKMYRDLIFFKKHSKKFLCLVHSDLFIPEQLEELSYFASVSIKVKGLMQAAYSDVTGYDRLCEITFKKPGGKIIKQEEAFYVEDDFKVTSKALQEVSDIKEPAFSLNAKEDMENLTTFKLGVHMSEKERNARDELKLPYLRTEEPDKGEIIYQPDADELEDDPDDDLDI